MGRVEINHAGLAAFTGPKGKKCIANLSWEKLRPVEYAKATQRSLEFSFAKGATLKKLYVGNLPFQATEQDISNWFTQAGATGAKVSLVTDKFTGQPRGFAFVEINNDEEAARVIQATGANFPAAAGMPLPWVPCQNYELHLGASAVASRLKRWRARGKPSSLWVRS